MNSENQPKNRLDSMPTKQKVMIVVTVIVVLIVIWQVMGLFGNSSSVPPTTFAPAPTTNMAANAPGAGGMTPASQNVPPGAAPIAQSVSTPQSAVMIAPREAPISKTPTQEEQDKVEKRYLKQLNDLEQLKIERQIEETNQAIATAKLATVTAEKSTAELLTKPAVILPDSAYANQLVSPTRSGASVPEGPPNEQIPPAPLEQIAPEVTYNVISVSMQFNKWTAVIGAQGKLYNVSVGDTLPLDGSIVSSINKNGVTLRKDNRTRKISMTTAI
jgi:hypothetical protein